MKLSENKQFMSEFDALIEKYSGVIDLDTTNGTIKPFKIEKGKWYMCNNDVYKYGDGLCFTKGKLYYCKDDNLIIDNYNVDIPVIGSWFRYATEDEIPHEPRFKVGDLVMDRTFAVEDYHGEPGQIVEVSMFNGKPHYRLMGIDGMLLENGNLINEYYVEKWTIQDAKDGDVLTLEDGSIETFICKEHINGSITYHVCYDGEDLHTNSFYSSVYPNLIHPATKEQRDLLFQKMKESGYEWSEETHELKKVQKRWRDDKGAPVNGYDITSNGTIRKCLNVCNEQCGYGIFATEAQAKSALAMARISQIMANDKRFGGVVTDDEWDNKGILKYSIARSCCNDIELYTGVQGVYYFLSFHTMEERDLFLEENRDLVEDYLMIPKKGDAE